MCKLQALLFLISVSNVISSAEYDYYWHEYAGVIPADAVVGGQDINGNDIFIGQAYIKNEGLIVVQIYPGKREVKAPSKGIKTVNHYTKILCGSMRNFAWLPVSASNLHLALLNKHAVIGGQEDGLGQINIGRISYEGEVRIGKVNSYAVGNSSFHFADSNNKEPSVTTYEVLVYYKDEDFLEVDCLVKVTMSQCCCGCQDLCRQHEKIFIIKNPKSGLVFDGSENPVKIQAFTGKPEQLWRMECADYGRFTFINVGNGMVMDIEGELTQGANLVTTPRDKAQNHRFYVHQNNLIMTSGYFIVNVFGQIYKPGTRVIIWPMTASIQDNEIFHFLYQ